MTTVAEKPKAKRAKKDSFVTLSENGITTKSDNKTIEVSFDDLSNQFNDFVMYPFYSELYKGGVEAKYDKEKKSFTFDSKDHKAVDDAVNGSRDKISDLKRDRRNLEGDITKQVKASNPEAQNVVFQNAFTVKDKTYIGEVLGTSSYLVAQSANFREDTKTQYVTVHNIDKFLAKEDYKNLEGVKGEIFPKAEKRHIRYESPMYGISNPYIPTKQINQEQQKTR